MSIGELRAQFTLMKKGRRENPAKSLRAAGALTADALALLGAEGVLAPILFKGKGSKTYHVVQLPDAPTRFSRAINDALFLSDPLDFTARWTAMLSDLGTSSGEFELSTDRDEVDRLIYTAVIAYAAATDLFQPGDRGGPGTFYEMLLGPIISLLTGRSETSAVHIPLDDGIVEKIPTDLAYLDDASRVGLVVPTKISTRERISQAYVHQRILESAQPAGYEYKSVLGICSENNVIADKTAGVSERTPDRCHLQDTLVPGTILLYQKYVAALSGLYYLDPPHAYLNSAPEGFPFVASVGDLLTRDLRGLLEEPA